MRRAIARGALLGLAAVLLIIAVWNAVDRLRRPKPLWGTRFGVLPMGDGVAS